MGRDGLPLLEGEGWGEVRGLSEKVAHLTLSLSFQERGTARPARDVKAADPVSRWTHAVAIGRQDIPCG